MFPFVNDFQWSIGLIVFLGLFFSVLTVVGFTLAAAWVRSRQELRKTPPEVFAWKSEFKELPQSARACRREIAGEVTGRVCENAFACGDCTDYAARLQTKGSSTDVAMPGDRFYHRGHTWVRQEWDGTLTIGLDDLASRILGRHTRAALPSAGTRLHRNGQAWQARRDGRSVRILSPIDGVVRAVGSDGDDWVLRVEPPAGGLDTRHLLTGTEARAWMDREMERLQLSLAGPAAPALADGGAVAEDLPAAVPGADWDVVWGQMFLEA